VVASAAENVDVRLCLEKTTIAVSRIVMPTSGTATKQVRPLGGVRGIDHDQPGKGESDRRASPVAQEDARRPGEVEREEAKTGGGEGHRQPTQNGVAVDEREHG